VAFRLRNLRTLNGQRLVVAVVLLAFIPLSVEVDAMAALAIVAAILCALIAYEAVHFADARSRVRNEMLHGRTGSVER
jgi:membrane protein implicated in regulation of membrane protease activity